MTHDHELDRLVRRAQTGDGEALHRLLAALRGPLVRFARGLGDPADAEDAAQDALLDISRAVGTYRWEASFLSWAYAVCARRVARRAARAPRDLATMADRIERSLDEPQDRLDEHEVILLAQEAHLACAFVVAMELTPPLRRAYLLGEALGVTHEVGGELCGCAPAAFRQRVSRARRQVVERIGQRLAAGEANRPPAGAADELDRILRLGDLHRARGRTTVAESAERAATLAAPTLMASRP